MRFIFLHTFEYLVVTSLFFSKTFLTGGLTKTLLTTMCDSILNFLFCSTDVIVCFSIFQPLLIITPQQSLSKLLISYCPSPSWTFNIRNMFMYTLVMYYKCICVLFTWKEYECFPPGINFNPLRVISLPLGIHSLF